jgi:hypothetical protein
MIKSLPRREKWSIAAQVVLPTPTFLDRNQAFSS